MNERLILAVTPGDPAGIGPEIVWKTIQSGELQSLNVELLCIGARAPFEALGAPITEHPAKPRPGTVWLLPAPSAAPKKAFFLPGYQAGWSIRESVKCVMSGECAALVTGPISKVRLKRGGFDFPGHTEFLAKLTKTRHVTMMLANEDLRVTLVTTHIGIQQVPKALTRAKIRLTIEQTANHLQRWWGVRKPRIAVAALNPHAGENGLFGKEELRVIEPELRALQKRLGKTTELVGPLPADTLFAKHMMVPRDQRYDAVVCMYHDQGLIPVKLLDFKNTVNITLGLPIIRTSVDHGVGFDIAGTGKADPSSFQSAVRLAARLARCQQNG